MRKNVLVSLLAVTSASTMPAWANADVDQIKTDAATDWEGASDLEIESGLIVSPSGATVTQNIGKLYPGTYTLTAETNENAKILIDGKELAADGQFKIDAVKDVTISIESKDGSQYKVGGFKLTLVYNFANANYYEGVTQDEAEKFYMIQKLASGPHPVMYGMNSRLVQKDGVIQEEVWKVDGMYGEAIEKII